MSSREGVAANLDFQESRNPETCDAATACGKCGHPEDEHRANVLPFVPCHHLNAREGQGVGFFGVTYSVDPCWCPNFEVSHA